ncbi:MAG: LysR substrate-binding domain-containing protein [Pseudomonadales bacterium]
MHFTLKHLRYFVKAGEHGSVTRAAEELHVSQPSISSAILHLEEATGLQLFVRHHAQGLSLTPAGRQFILKSKQLLLDAENLGHYASTLGEDIAGSLRIVSFPTFTPILLPSLMKQFIETYPEVNIQCDESHQKDIIQSLMDGRYELALTYDLQLPQDIQFEPVIEFPPYVALAADHPLAQRDELSLAELAEHPMVGEARMVGLMGAIELTPDKAARAPWSADKGTVGLMCREHCFNNNLVMRHVGDTMIISPPLTISREQVDELIEKAKRCLDLTWEQTATEGLR